jgi:DNA processing protein
VPGPVNSKYSEGCNNFIKSHKAHLISSGSDLTKVLGWDIQEERSKRQYQAKQELNQDELSIYNIFKGADPFLVDEVSALSNMDSSKLSGILLTLEFKGLIHSLPGKQYVRA